MGGRGTTSQSAYGCQLPWTAVALIREAEARPARANPSDSCAALPPLALRAVAAVRERGAEAAARDRSPLASPFRGGGSRVARDGEVVSLFPTIHNLSDAEL